MQVKKKRTPMSKTSLGASARIRPTKPSRTGDVKHGQTGKETQPARIPHVVKPCLLGRRGRSRRPSISVILLGLGSSSTVHIRQTVAVTELFGTGIRTSVCLLLVTLTWKPERNTGPWKKQVRRSRFLDQRVVFHLVTRIRRRVWLLFAR